jgi:hypothetical protein
LHLEGFFLLEVTMFGLTEEEIEFASTGHANRPLRSSLLRKGIAPPKLAVDDEVIDTAAARNNDDAAFAASILGRPTGQVEVLSSRLVAGELEQEIRPVREISLVPFGPLLDVKVLFRDRGEENLTCHLSELRQAYPDGLDAERRVTVLGRALGETPERIDARLARVSG